MWIELFVLGGIWFYLLSVITVIIILQLLMDDKFFGSAFLIGGFIAIIHLFGDAHFFQHVIDNPVWALVYIVGYLGIGAGWSFFKWWRVLLCVRKRYDELKAEFLINKKVTDGLIPDALKDEWRKHVISNRCYKLNYHYSDIEGYNPAIPPLSRNKARITGWMVYWPISFVLFFFEDFLAKIFDAIYDMFSNVYQRISDSVFKGMGDDFKSDDSGNDDSA